MTKSASSIHYWASDQLRVHRPTDLPDRDQLLRAQAWVEAHTDDPDEVREIMQMLAGPMGRNSQP